MRPRCMLQFSIGGPALSMQGAPVHAAHIGRIVPNLDDLSGNHRNLGTTEYVWVAVFVDEMRYWISQLLIHTMSQLFASMSLSSTAISAPSSISASMM